MFPPIQSHAGKLECTGPAPQTWNASHVSSAFRSIRSFRRRWSARMKTKILKRSCVRRDSYIPPILKNCESTRSSARREVFIRERLGPRPAGKGENRSEHTTLLRGSEAARASGACGEWIVFTTCAPQRLEENLRKARNRSG